MIPQKILDILLPNKTYYTLFCHINVLPKLDTGHLNIIPQVLSFQNFYLYYYHSIESEQCSFIAL